MLAYLNGNWIDYASVTVPPWDYGFAMGVSVTEQLRTFNGELFCASWHVDRLLDGLSIIGLESPLARDHLIELATQVVQKNQHDIPPGGDMGVGICITPGGLTKFAPASNQEAQGPTMLAYGYPLNFSGLADRYANGMSLSIVETREIPDACIPRQLKCRSRMHYYLAEQEAAAKQPDSRALLLDLEGNVAEATVATVVIVERGRVVVPPAAMILPGTALKYLIKLCEAESIEFVREAISPDRLKAADEVLWLSTPVAMLPVTGVDSQTIGTGRPGPLFKQLIERWSTEVGVDIIGQACAWK
jgi:branched-subunit amino acid aminotransferase/4-amino-4-deoxychorismate lyase